MAGLGKLHRIARIGLIHGKLSTDKRDALANMVTERIPFRVGITEAARDWSKADWDKVLNMEAYAQVCKEKSLAQSDADLITEARKYAGESAVIKLLGDIVEKGDDIG